MEIKFVSYEEMEDYYDGKIPDYTFCDGDYVVNEEKKSMPKPISTEKEKNTLVRTYIGENKGYMYVGKKGVTLYRQYAAKFTKHQAETKTRHMTQNTKLGYEWKAVPV